MRLRVAEPSLSKVKTILRERRFRIERLGGPFGACLRPDCTVSTWRVNPRFTKGAATKKQPPDGLVVGHVTGDSAEIQ